MSTTIVVATDGSELAVYAAVQGLSVLRPVDTVVVATAVFDLDPALAYDGSGHAGPTMTEAELLERRRQASEEGQAILDQTVAALGPVLDDTASQVEVRLLQGSAGPLLVQLADELSADALVLGTRGRGGLTRALLGSVSDHVVRHATCPVLTLSRP